MEKDRQIHPLLVSDELINARGLMVFDNIHQMPIYHEPYVAPYFTISLNIQGGLMLNTICGQYALSGTI